jgi:mutator protein MutT
MDDLKPHFHVTAGLLWRDGKLLITKRPPGTHLEGHWEFPGGKQEGKETLEACLFREIREELGVAVKVGEKLLTVQHDYEEKRITLHFYNCKHLKGEPRNLEDQEMLWVFPYELKRLAFPPPDKAIIDRLISP